VNTEQLLTALLEYSGVVWQRDMGEIRFRFTSGWMTWETACRCTEERVLIYGRYPFQIPADRRTEALEACSEINSRVIRGGMFLTREGRAVFRTWADLRDIYTARDTLARALEYNIAAVTRFWGRMAPDNSSMSKASVSGSSEINHISEQDNRKEGSFTAGAQPL